MYVYNDSFLAVMITSLIALFFGFAIAFGGYRLFLILLPITGFIFGFGLGAQSVQAAFGDGFLATGTSWMIGFLIAAIFAFASYFFYFFGIGLLAFAIGYSAGVGLLGAIGLDFGILAWFVGVGLGIGAVFVTFWLNLQKYVIIAATAILGSMIIIGTFLYMFGGVPTGLLLNNPVRAALASSPLWMLTFLAMVAVAAVSQYKTTRIWEGQMSESLYGLSADSALGEPPPASQKPTPVQAAPVSEVPPPGQQIAS
jgi:hypothetical protein